jgi:PAS domain S-box-containing protein
MQRDEMIEAESSQTKQHILIVDDDAFMRTTFHDALVEAGFMATVVQDGATAVACARMYHFDLILLDLLMPGIDGFKTCQEIHSVIGHEQTPVVIISCLNDSASIAKAYDAGATDFITKPINHELLVRRLRYILQASQSLREMRSARDSIKMRKEAVESLPIGIGITITDTCGKIVYANSKEAEMHGYGVEELFDMQASLLAPDAHRKPFPPEAIREFGLWEREGVNVRRNGEEFPVRLSSLAVRNSDGKCIGVVTACEDVTSTKESEKKIQQLAYYDTLTELPNRMTLLERLREALSLAEREESSIGVCFSIWTTSRMSTIPWVTTWGTDCSGKLPGGSKTRSANPTPSPESAGTNLSWC